MGTPGEQVRFFALLGFLLICLFGGGASRADVWSLLYLRPAAILCLLVMFLSPGPWEFRRYRTPFILLGLFAATMVLQLIPLPPALWTHLPGFSRYAEAYAAAGMEVPWRPMSLAPDLTLNSLLALLPCVVVLVGFAGIREDQRRTVLPVLIGFVAFNVLLSVAQFAGGPESPAYLYAISNTEAPVGFFSNRNHNAALLALALPMLAVWTAMPAQSRQYRRSRVFIALALAVFIILLILATGSRAGVVCGLVGLAAGLWIAPSFTTNWDRKWRLAFRIASVAIPLLLVVLAIYSNRAFSLVRMSDNSALNGELRLEALPVLGDMLRTFSPQGIGYGAFDPVYRGFEPDALLSTQYLNHAHNDLVELALTGGVLALLVLLLLLSWWGTRALRIFRGGSGAQEGLRFARLGAVMTLILLGASLVDYPLRTPLMAAIFTIACCWLTAPREAASPVAEAPARVGRRARWKQRDFARVGGAIALAAVLGWVTLGVTAAGVLGRLSPAMVSWWGPDADAHATRAARMMEVATRPTPAVMAAAADEARAALSREPVNAIAARTLALVAAAQGNVGQANRLMAYVETLSRRDLPNQLWMIEANVRRNDIAGALRHYDRALRTSESARDLLFPILIQAAASEGVTPRLAELIAGRPEWWGPFLERLVAEGRSSASIEALVVAARLDPANSYDRGLLSGAVNRLVEIGDYPRALAIYRRAGGRADALVRNGDFEAENRFLPLDWVLSDSTGTGGQIRTGLSGSGRALLMVAEPGSAGGTVARQMLILPPGSYRLSGVAGRVTGSEQERPRLLLVCVRTNATLLDLRLPVSGAGGQAFGGDFAVAASACPAQWLIVSVSGPTGDDAPWVDRISVQGR